MGLIGFLRNKNQPGEGRSDQYKYSLWLSLRCARTRPRRDRGNWRWRGWKRRSIWTTLMIPGNDVRILNEYLLYKRTLGRVGEVGEVALGAR